MISLVSVDGKKYVELCDNAKASNDDQSALLKTHQRAAKSKRPLYIINKSCLESLQAMQSGSDADDTLTNEELAAKAAADEALATAANGDAAGTTSDTTTDGDAAGTSTTDANGDGGSNGGENEALTLVQAVRKLDPANDEHWTTSGQPAMKAVGALFGKSVTRASVAEVAPGYDREAATEAAE